jgi:hypothetical protein
MLSKLDLIVVWCLLSEKMLPCVIENLADILFVIQLKYIVCDIYACFTLVCFCQYIGSKETDQKAAEVAKLRVLDFWTPENHYRWSVSRYGGHVSGSVDPVDRSRLLLCGMVLTNDFLNQHIFKHLIFFILL